MSLVYDSADDTRPQKKAPSIESFSQIALKIKDLVPGEYVNIVFYWLICTLIWILHDLEPFPIVNMVFHWLTIIVAGTCWLMGRSIFRLRKYHFRIGITNSWPMNFDGFKHCLPIKNTLACVYHVFMGRPCLNLS